ncbi:MAG: hypothetical protein DRQ02_07190 [Candidatus Latescibacterota bacterium]|nr:MAG: hypothetical protein DRQ02_07190 [Candidatus Latescibacterota bacterium]
MADHAYPLSAALRSCGIPAEALPESDDQTLLLGRKYSTGRECFPFIVTTGDFLRKIEEPGFDPDKAAFFMPLASGPCRFGQYSHIHRVFLDRLGHKQVAVISPTSANSYADIGGASLKLRIRAWQALVATDILQKLLHETRPYEVNQGDTDRVYKKALAKLTEAVEKGKNLVRLMKQIAEEFKQIKIDRRERKPIIGIVGEIFMRNNRFSNDNVIRRVEALGGEAWLAPISEWIYYTTQRYKEDSAAERKYRDLLKAILQEKVQRYYEHRLEKPVKKLLLNNEEPRTTEVLQYSAPYMHFSFGGEAILTIGKAVDYIRKGASGIINVMPFSCMPGTVVAIVSKRFREDFNGIPWLNASYDGQEDASMLVRLEAFMHQARQYRDKRRFG